MSVFKIIKTKQAKQLFGLFRFFIKPLFFTIATVKATLNAYQISQKYFPNKHGLHNKANAFRHALWNVLIAESCFKVNRDVVKANHWAKKITNWYEDLFINKELPRFMDLHNNQFGREFLKENYNQSKEKLVQKLLFFTDKSIKISYVNEGKENEHKLVYISE